MSRVAITSGRVRPGQKWGSRYNTGQPVSSDQSRVTSDQSQVTIYQIQVATYHSQKNIVKAEKSIVRGERDIDKAERNIDKVEKRNPAITHQEHWQWITTTTVFEGLTPHYMSTLSELDPGAKNKTRPKEDRTSALAQSRKSRCYRKVPLGAI